MPPVKRIPPIRWTPDGRTDARGAADYIGVAPKTLANWRSLGTGPAFVQPHRRVWYRKVDLDAWLAGCRATSTAQASLLRGGLSPALSVVTRNAGTDVE